MTRDHTKFTQGTFILFNSSVRAKWSEQMRGCRSSTKPYILIIIALNLSSRPLTLLSCFVSRAVVEVTLKFCCLQVGMPNLSLTLLLVTGSLRPTLYRMVCTHGLELPKSTFNSTAIVHDIDDLPIAAFRGLLVYKTSKH